MLREGEDFSLVCKRALLVVDSINYQTRIARVSQGGRREFESVFCFRHRFLGSLIPYITVEVCRNESNCRFTNVVFSRTINTLVADNII